MRSGSGDEEGADHLHRRVRINLAKSVTSERLAELERVLGTRLIRRPMVLTASLKRSFGDPPYWDRT